MDKDKRAPTFQNEVCQPTCQQKKIFGMSGTPSSVHPSFLSTRSFQRVFACAEDRAAVGVEQAMKKAGSVESTVPRASAVVDVRRRWSTESLGSFHRSIRIDRSVDWPNLWVPRSRAQRSTEGHEVPGFRSLSQAQATAEDDEEQIPSEEEANDQDAASIRQCRVSFCLITLLIVIYLRSSY